jgi:serine/threonine protein kinase
VIDDHNHRDDDGSRAHEDLTRIGGQAEREPPNGKHAGDDRTRMKDDATRIRPDGTRMKDDAAAPRGDRTRIRDASSREGSAGAAPAPDATILKPSGAEGATGGSKPSAAGDSPHESHLPLGTVIRERFELESIIGFGSMGIVYRAIDRLHLEMHDRDPFVAIKVLGEQFKQYPKALMTLQREVRKAQILSHENIIRVYTFDRDGSVAYMTMELLDGKPLSAVIAEHPNGVPLTNAETMIVGMAKALECAHQNGIVHSDFKPGNVFLTNKGQIKVLDFGVARAVTADNAERTPPDEREIGGYTPAYASPEMLRGERPVPADDVFALAIVAHELLTGRHPFGHEAVNEEQLDARPTRELKGLRWSQKKALARALAGVRELRHPDASAFLKHFLGSNALRMRILVGTLVASLLALIVFTALRDDALGPAVAFGDLPAATQEEFNTAIREGETALRFGDAGVNDAFAYFSAAYALHPNNPRAIEGLESVADRFLSSVQTADAATQRKVFELLYCQDYLPRYAPVATTCESLLGSECAVIAGSCPQGP